jgi:hypothetical protein
LFGVLPLATVGLLGHPVGSESLVAPEAVDRAHAQIAVPESPGINSRYQFQKSISPDAARAKMTALNTKMRLQEEK